MNPSDFLPDNPEGLERFIDKIREEQCERSASDSPPDDKTPTPCEGVGAKECSIEAENTESLLAENDNDKKSCKAGFQLVHASDVREAEDTADFVEDLLVEQGASVIYGPSNTGKSFWALELGAAVADGRHFMGLETDRGAVIYVSLEGETGAKNRIHALRKANRLLDDSPLYLCFAQLSMLSERDVEKVLSTVSEAAELSGIKVKLVIIDTLSRSIPGGNENEGKDMGKLINSVDRIRAQSGAHVALIHHTGKNENNGARGHSSLRAAVDTEIKISRSSDSEVSHVKVTKQRDMPKNSSMAFRLNSLHLGTNRRGKPITSCIVHQENEVPDEPKKKQGRPPKCSPEDLLELLPVRKVADWEALAKSKLGIGRTKFHELKKALIEDEKAFECPDTGMWLRLKG